MKILYYISLIVSKFMLLDGYKSIKDIKAQPAENLAVIQCNTCIKPFFTELSRNIFRQMCIY